MLPLAGPMRLTRKYAVGTFRAKRFYGFIDFSKKYQVTLLRVIVQQLIRMEAQRVLCAPMGGVQKFELTAVHSNTRTSIHRSTFDTFGHNG